MKKCPFCAEQIQDEAIICRYCGRDLQPGLAPTIEPALYPTTEPTITPLSSPTLKKSKKKGILITIGVLLALCMLCMVFSVIYSQSPQGKASATRSAQTSTQKAANDSAKTATEKAAQNATQMAKPLIDTSTPRPTQTVSVAEATTVKVALVETKPTATETPVVVSTVADPVESDYMSKAMVLSITCAEYMDQIATQSSKASENVGLVFDATWKFDTAKALAGMKTTCAALDEITPVPSKYATVHLYLSKAANEFDLVIKNYGEGMDELNTDKLAAAADHMQTGSNYIQLATDELKKLK